LPRRRESGQRDDQTTLSLSEDAHRKLTDLKERGFFGEMRDAYRAAIALALAEGLVDAREGKRTRTYLNAGSLDPDGILRDIVLEYFPQEQGGPYEITERLGEAGVLALWERLQRHGELDHALKQPGSASPNV
jgi:hypothetical protein